MNPGLQYEIDRVKPQRSTEWLQGPRVTAEDLKHGRGCIERLARAEFPGTAGSPVTRSNTAAQPSLHVMPFGKHKGRSMAVVQDEDPSYWRWAIAEVSGFAAKAKKAGLLDD